MRIAQISPLHERVPPRLYGGTERVVSFLTEELVRQGHDVTLFASGDSQTSAKLVRCCDAALRLDPAVRDALPHHMIMLDEVRRRINQFDVLHFHIDFIHAPLVRDLAGRTLTTLHGRLDLPDLGPFYAAFRDLPLASISDNQRGYLGNGCWHGTVYHGLPRNLLPLRLKPEGYLAFLGRISPEKRSRSGYRDRSQEWSAAQDRGEGGSRRPGLLGDQDPPDGRGQPERRVHWRNWRA